VTTSGFRDIRSPRSSEAVTRPARAMTVRLYYLWTLGNDRTTATAFPPLRASLVRAGPAGSAELHGTLHWISIQNDSGLPQGFLPIHRGRLSMQQTDCMGRRSLRMPPVQSGEEAPCSALDGARSSRCSAARQLHGRSRRARSSRCRTDEPRQSAGPAQSRRAPE
jgi:hypothetical protein